MTRKKMINGELCVRHDENPSRMLKQRFCAVVQNSKRLLSLITSAILSFNAIAANYTLHWSGHPNVMSSIGYRADITSITPLSYSGTVTIPEYVSQINTTYEVMGIAAHAFAGSKITKLYVPETISYIDYLGSCTDLKKIVLRMNNFTLEYGTDTRFDERAFIGTHPDCIVYVPKGFYTWKDWESTYLKPGDLFGGRPIEWFHYHVKFNANGGTGSMPQQTIYTDETTKLTANAFTRSGYSFSGWATSAGGEKKYSNNASVKNLDTGINATVNLYAVWTANKYSVKFNTNGGTGTMSNQAFVYGTSQNLTANGFSRDGYSFVGWATSATGAKVYSDKESVKNLTTTANGIVNLYAIWECQASVENVSAKQRYPWNGLVDLKFTITGTSGIKYDAIFTAKDMIGNTNVAMKTICKADGTSIVATEPLLAGTYNWIWDATADLPKDFKCDRMTISAIAATGVSPEFKMDLSGMGPWDVRTATTTEAICYSSTWATNALDGAKAVVKVYPVKREKPKYIAIDLSSGTTATHYPIEYLDEIPGGSWSDEYKTSKLVLRHIPAGSFIMGGRNTDYPGAVNTNLHMVTLTKDFYMGVFEVTQRQWELVMGNRPSAFSNETCYATRPVECVSYVDIRGDEKGITWPESEEVDEYSFMGKLRKKSGLTSFDLPTEAQWEYACRAGTTTGLNNGKNLSTLTELCPNANEVARYGWNNDKDAVAAAGYSTNKYPDETDKGTAVVGSYFSNNYGIFDMHGNVWEFCLDADDPIESGSVDPVGSLDLTTGRRQLRGGSWYSYGGGHAYEITSGDHHKYKGVGIAETGRLGTMGFRLCLQGGEVLETAKGVEIVSATGEGDAAWTPTKAGTYYLTHETQTNGVNGAEVLGAWFTVGAPELTFVPDGDLTPGVKVAIAGAGEGWTVRYTTDGAAPTSSSAEYTEPIALNDSATIRAVAFSDGGLESLEYSATFSLMSVGGAVARPRYPWNGLVDIDVTVKGAENEDYLVSLVARDLDGGTNLPLRTAWQLGGTVTNNAFLVKPGAHRFTWDAAADITNDCEFANVVVSVLAEHSAIIGAKKVLSLEVADYAGTETLANVPVLVRLSTAIDGFSYADFVDTNGGDLVFTDESGNIVYPHEIDEWHTDGESLVWVKLPRMVNGTKFKMAYGNSQLITHNSQLSSHEVWSDYAGVWHMNEDSGTAYDSTANGLDGTPSKGSNALADINQMVAYENGACGRARVNGMCNGSGLNYMLVPSAPVLHFGGRFVSSGWFRANDVGKDDDPRLITKKNDSEYAWAKLTGFDINYENSPTNLLVRGQSKTSFTAITPSMLNVWVNILVIFEDDVVTTYANGRNVGTGSISAVLDNDDYLTFGGYGGLFSLNGQYDEIRLRGGSLSADRIKADYDMIVNRNFLRYGSVENGKGAAE